ncbi:MAG TPA: NAD-dependent epimerase/dehydratase family protein [Actinomycetota bacterium]|nr:NAD-dependent epimerase/dehydratase family protein [Actinomycetota bacterium]
MSSHLLITGGAGFLGSHFIRHVLGQGAGSVTNVDCLTYAGDPRRLSDVADGGKYELVQLDIADADPIRRLVNERRPDAIVHYAAESHVTRSESDPDRFYRTNLEGTRVLLDAAVAAGVRRFVHVSTDEVYGSILEGSFTESDKPEGTGSAASPYSKSKALADDLARSYSDRLEVIVVRPTNAFGPWQYPEKVFPRWVTRGLRSQPMLVWGDGLYIRQWLYAEDFARAVALVLDRGVNGEAYNIGPVHEPEITNLALANWLAEHLGLDSSGIQMTGYDRPDHDRRYAVDSTKIRALGWRSGDVWAQFAESVNWYRDNRAWWESLIAEAESIYADSAPAGKGAGV